MNNTAVTTFGFKTHGASDITHTIRVVDIAGNPWFVAADVCRVLDLYIQPNGQPSVTSALRPLSSDEKGLERVQTLGGPQRLSVISESGLYKLIMRSDKPQAKDFQNWVTRVVLPAIRKDGAYIKDEEKVATGEMDEDEFVLKAVAILQRKVERLKAERNAACAARDAAKAETKEAVEVKDAMKESIGRFNHSLRDTVRMLDDRISLSGISKTMVELGYLRSPALNVYRVRRGPKTDGRFVEKHDPVRGFCVIFATAEGKEELARLVKNGAFPRTDRPRSGLYLA